MLYVGIDVAKHKHDVFIVDSEGLVHADGLTIANDHKGFDTLHETIMLALFGENPERAKVGLEHTGHYSINSTVLSTKQSRSAKPRRINLMQESSQGCSSAMNRFLFQRHLIRCSS